ncbi:MAG: glycerophosphodiester phosphodiesterase [Candidatus Saliniplasma sp.]
MSRKTKIIAHRGGYGVGEFENTIRAFERAIKIGADMIEFDIRKTDDDFLIAFHDRKVKGHEISSLSYRELSELSGKKDIPKVPEILESTKGKIGLDIELKETGYEDMVLGSVKKYLENDEFMIKSFQDKSVKRLKDLDPTIKAGLLLGTNTPENRIITRFSELFPVKRLDRCQADFVCPQFNLLHLLFVKRMKKNGFEIYVWTVNKERLMRKLLKKGVDGIITDRPKTALSYRQRFL